MVKVLIVEDSKTYNNTISSLLRSKEIQILQAFTLKEAIELIKENIDIEYVLLDLILPDGEGDDLIFELTSIAIKMPKIIVLSGNQDIQRRNYLFENGVVDYFSKDIPLKTLVKDIQKVIKDLENNKTKNILVIDDSLFVLKSIKNILSTKNYNLKLAKDPLLAFDILNENEKIDLIFCDLEMPRMNGLDFLIKIKQNHLWKDIPVLILSGSNNRESYAKVLKHGAIDFIKKPFLTEEILLKADLHISQSNYIREIAAQAKELQEYKRILNESDMISKTNAKGIITEVNE